MELQRDEVYAKYKSLVGTIIIAEVSQIWKKEILLIDDAGNDLFLPKTEQIPSDFYGKGQTVKAVIQRADNDNNRARVTVSRTDNLFLQRLLESEVPEIGDGLILIRAIARIPGERAKVAVESYDERIDAVGACVGMKGARIRGIVRELRNENIDVINYSTNTALFIQRALGPAKISSIRLYDDERRAEVFLRPEEVSLAIGKGGLNIKLACMLTDYTIDVFRDIDITDEEDIYLDEFADEIDIWVLDALKGIGCTTAKAALGLGRESIMEQADLEEQTVDEVLAILRAEFDEDELRDLPSSTKSPATKPDGDASQESAPAAQPENAESTSESAAQENSMEEPANVEAATEDSVETAAGVETPAEDNVEATAAQEGTKAPAAQEDSVESNPAAAAQEDRVEESAPAIPDIASDTAVEIVTRSSEE
jgi:N utilization substance protein A